MSRRAAPKANTGGHQAGGCPMNRRATKGHDGAHFVDPKANSGVRNTEDPQ
jgi:hypothetical protein